MAKDKKPRVRRPKPLLAAAVICEKVLEDEDGAMSAIRMIDTFTFFHLPDAFSHPDARIPVSMKALLAFKSGEVVGERTLRLVLRNPARKKKVILEKTLPFQGDEKGVNFTLNLDLKLKATGGLYWIDVLMDGIRLTSMPLKVYLQAVDPVGDQTKPHHNQSS